MGETGVRSLNQLNHVRAKRHHQSGQGLVEYALILMLVAVLVVLVLGVIGHQTENVFSNVSHGLST
jgi:pilus assembly protein Flp/PilA